MNINLQKSEDATSAVLTVSIDKKDYESKVAEKLNTYRKKASINGFRPGKAPVSLIKKMYESAIIMEEVNHLVSHSLSDYIKQNELDVIGQPLTSATQEQVNFDKEPLNFAFDLALHPQTTVVADKTDKLEYLKIKITEEELNNAVDLYRRRNAKYTNPEIADKAEDMLKGTLIQLDDKDKEAPDGIRHADIPLMPNYFANKEQAALFLNKKVGDSIIFNPSKGYDGNETQLAALLKIEKEQTKDYTGNFKFEISEISRYELGDINQELFDSIYGEGVVKSEEEFRAKVKEEIAQKNTQESDFRLVNAARNFYLDKAGELKINTDLIKRLIEDASEDKKEISEEELKATCNELRWNTVKNALLKQFGVQINDDDVLKAARIMVSMQFTSWGYNNFPDQLLDEYAMKSLENEETRGQAISIALNLCFIAALKDTVKLVNKTVSREEFYKKDK